MDRPFGAHGRFDALSGNPPFKDAPTRRAFWDKVLGDEFQRQSEHLDEKALTELLGDTLKAAEAPAPKPEMGKVTLVGAGPGSADYLTLGGLRALEQADVVLYDALWAARCSIMPAGMLN